MSGSTFVHLDAHLGRRVVRLRRFVLQREFPKANLFSSSFFHNLFLSFVFYLYNFRTTSTAAATYEHLLILVSSGVTQLVKSERMNQNPPAFGPLEPRRPGHLERLAAQRTQGYGCSLLGTGGFSLRGTSTAYCDALV